MLACSGRCGVEGNTGIWCHGRCVGTVAIQNDLDIIGAQLAFIHTISVHKYINKLSM